MVVNSKSGNNDTCLITALSIIGYSWVNIKAMIKDIPSLKIKNKGYAMFLFSELFMDLLKLVYFKKNNLKEHSDMIKMNNSILFSAYRLVFPLLYLFFIMEDLILCPLFKGHILILVLEKSS